MLKKAFLILNTVFAWTVTVIIFVSHCLISMAISRFYQDSEWMIMRLAAVFLKASLWIDRMPITVIGSENIPSEGNFILVSNHQSHLDIAVFICSIKRKFSFLAKKELLDVPFLGWDLRAQGHIAVDRHNHRSAIKEMQRVEGMLKNGKSIIIFPEGTRTDTGKMGSFKKGAFVMSVHTGVPVIPCRIEGTYHCLNKNSWIISPGPIKLTLYPPIYPHLSEDPKAEIQRLMLESEALIGKDPFEQ